jgi:hypothetical protein
MENHAKSDVLMCRQWAYPATNYPSECLNKYHITLTQLNINSSVISDLL